MIAPLLLHDKVDRDFERFLRDRAFRAGGDRPQEILSFSPGADVAADMPRLRNRRLKAVVLGTTPRGAVGLPPHPLGVVPLRGLSVYPRAPSGSTPRGPVGLPSGVGVVVPTGPRGSGVSRRPRRSLIVSLFISFSFRLWLITHRVCKPLQTRRVMDGAVAEVPHFNRAPSKSIARWSATKKAQKGVAMPKIRPSRHFCE